MRRNVLEERLRRLIPISAAVLERIPALPVVVDEKDMRKPRGLRPARGERALPLEVHAVDIRLLREQLEHLDAPDEIDIELVALVRSERMRDTHRRDDRLPLVGRKHREQCEEHEDHRDGNCDEQAAVHTAQP